jgi:mannose-6-phosphate isomerase-like protein (cupin superfamily)
MTTAAFRIPESAYDATSARVGDAEVRHARGGHIAFLAGAECGDGAWSLTEHLLPPRTTGTLPHRHLRTTECFYVLEGTLSITVGSENVLAGSGSCTIVPAGVTHSFRNRCDQPVRFLEIASPCGREQFLHELIDIARQEQGGSSRNGRALLAVAGRRDSPCAAC